MTLAATSILAGLSLGLLGSFHCVGMCGPIALILPVQDTQGKISYLRILLYNLGRATSYATLGLIFGLLGKSFSLFGWQQILTILCGVLMLLFVLMQYTSLFRHTRIDTFSTYIKNKISHYLQSKISPRSMFMVGYFNGLLPCGLVYVALAAALAAATPLYSALLMFVFGIGTMPAMMILMMTKKIMSLRFRQRINLLTPYLISLLAILLIVRGLNLGIPYLSPHLEADCKVSCCHK